MKILVTGGAGYIGSTVASAALDSGHDVVILDDFSEGKKEFVKDRIFYEGDIADQHLLDTIFSEHNIDAVVHCAASIVVPESWEKPLEYYENNVGKTLDLLKGMLRNNVNSIVFSSSASVYADPTDGFAVTEDSPLDTNCPYAETKRMMERILIDTAQGTPLRPIILRYFNPIGADPLMRTGQQREKISHVVWKMVDALENDTQFTITGCDWNTPDGTGIRDYIHIWDLACAHVSALEKLPTLVNDDNTSEIINIGTGRPMSVRQLTDAFMEATQSTLRVAEGPARPGDVIGAYAVTEKAQRLLGWSSKLSVAQGIKDAVQWSRVRKDILGY
ncbi:MAG: UDP-glucose 4-epimerase GalE [Actinomycetaceae bacterium]|nr:UDP-glucose 4-epimerase GalE [Actinomycetaceae bacterium]